MSATRKNGRMKHKIIFQDLALRDLRSLYLFIRDSQNSPLTAIKYISRIKTQCEKLSQFPHRGTRRDDLREGLRIIGFERRVSIAFTVNDDTVRIARIFYGGRDVDALLENNSAAPVAEGGDDSDNWQTWRELNAHLALALAECAQAQRVQANEACGIAVIVSDRPFFEGDEILIIERIRALTTNHPS